MRGGGNEGRVPQPRPIHGDSPETKNEVVPLKKQRYKKTRNFWFQDFHPINFATQLISKVRVVES